VKNVGVEVRRKAVENSLNGASNRKLSLWFCRRRRMRGTNTAMLFVST
jgi:hypothetical protein